MIRGFQKDAAGEWWAYKDPDDDLDYAIDWADEDEDWLEGDTIVSATWDVPAGLESHNPSHTDTISKIWLKGGTVPETYLVTCHILTAGARKADQSFRLRIKQR